MEKLEHREPTGQGLELIRCAVGDQTRAFGEADADGHLLGEGPQHRPGLLGGQFHDLHLTRAARTKITGSGPRLGEVTRAEHRWVTEAFITACANGDLAALISVLDPEVWGVGTVLMNPPIPDQVNHGPDAVAMNLLRHQGPGATVVCAAEPVLLAFDRGRLFAVVVLTFRGERVVKIEATADPSARQP